MPEKLKPYRHILGGFQLMQRLTVAEAETRMQTMAALWNKARRDDLGPDGKRHVFHVEFGHYSNLPHFELFERYAVANADSLGMNEVEMRMLLDYWEGQMDDINAHKVTQPTISDVLTMTDQLLSKAKELKLPLSRLHLHPYGSFLMCYDKEKWEDARDAIIKSSIVVPKYCMSGSDYYWEGNWLADTDAFMIPNIPSEISLPSGEQLHLSRDTLTYDFALNPTQGTHCYLQFFVKC